VNIVFINVITAAGISVF